MAKINPSQPFMMSSGTSKLRKIGKNRDFFVANFHLLKSTLGVVRFKVTVTVRVRVFIQITTNVK